MGFFRKNSTAVDTSVPTTRANSHHSGSFTAPGTNRSKMPPWGTTVDAPAAIEMAPAAAEPAINDGITRSGSLAAKGMAPSVMNESPNAHAGLPASRSSADQRPGNRTVASARASGGVLPATITAAIGSGTAGAAVTSPTAKV